MPNRLTTTRLRIGAEVFARNRDYLGVLSARSPSYFEVTHPQLGSFWLHAECVLKFDPSQVVLTILPGELHGYRRARPGEDEEVLPPDV
ncbi:MAG: hypothetical protein ACM3S1_05360 [Hyphomicrobiales bacterium]